MSLIPRILSIKIDFDSRKDSGSLNDCLVGIDGTDFRIRQQGDATKGNPFASHKYKGKSALRYELAVDILAGTLVRIDGPYPAGQYMDITIFRNGLADKGYVGEAPEFVKCPNCPTVPEHHLPMMARVMKRHETLNGRLKNWGILEQVFRQRDITHHADVLRAVAIITQLTIENGEPLFQVEYDDVNW